MIHTGLPFYNPFIGVGNVAALNWALQTQPSPPTSPPSSPVSSQKISSFSIDAILGRHHHHHHHQPSEVGVSRALERRREERLSRSAPYSAAQLSNGHLGIGNAVSPGGGSSKAKTKRVRTIFTAEQLERLETEFAHQQYMVGPERQYLAITLQLTEAQVKVWFQNRRIKWRKAVQEQNQARFSSKSPEEGDTKINLPISPLRVNDESSSSDSYLRPESEERDLDLNAHVKSQARTNSQDSTEHILSPGFSPARMSSLCVSNVTNSFRSDRSENSLIQNGS